VDFYNEAQPITLRLHQLNLLPGIGKKLRNDVLDQRKRKPFESFEEIEERISGLHNPEEVLVERILEELHEEDLKYRLFVRDDEE
jgi:putative nucleotide binding protein